MNFHKNVQVAGIILCALAAASHGPLAAAGATPPGVAPLPPGAAQPEIVPLAPGRLHLRAGVIDTLALPDARLAPALDPARQYIIQLDAPMTPERRNALEDAGITLADYLPAFAYLADLTQADPLALAETDFIVWVGPWLDEWKIDPEVGTRTDGTPERLAMREQNLIPIEITLFRGADRQAVLNALGQLEAQVHFTDTVAGNPIISATIQLDRVPHLAQLNEVQFIEEAPDITTRNSNVRWVVQSNQSGITPLYDHNLMGQGQIAGILDTRVAATHCSFNDPSNPIGPNHRKIVAYNTSLGSESHGTHVAGTAVGDAGTYDHRRGVAYLGRLVFHTWPSFTEAAIYERFQLHHSQGARDHTNSWGDDWTTAYNGLSRGIDAFQWQFEESQTYWAVTNMSALKNPENAKNTLAVGATSPPPNQHNHCTGGTGPTSDGRQKPEIYAPGCSTMSSTPGTCNTGSMSGTSMASPAVAGLGMLVRQYYMEGFYPFGSANPADAFTPSGALIKATLLNSAVDMTGVSGYPSNQEGWGRALAVNTLHFEGDDRGLIVVDVRNTEGLSTGMTDEHTITVVDSSEKLKITLVWTDPPGTAGTSFASVNDLDLIVSGPDGVFLGNVFSGGVSVQGGTNDDRNNVEQVHIANPTPGMWTIQVNGAAVNQYTQGYALVVSGAVATEEPPLTLAVLPPGAPTLIEPGEQIAFDVRIVPGQENIVPGSKLLHWRFDGGAFTSALLVHVEDDVYRAALPPALCSDVPEFYVSVEGDGGTVRTAPHNAPSNVFTTSIGVIEENELLHEYFATGLPAGWATTGLWHATNACAVANQCSNGLWAYYGQSGSCNYDTGGINSGEMISSQIMLPAVPPGGTITLSFCYNLVTEPAQSYDIARFSINGQNWTQLTDSSAWTTFATDVTSLADRTVRLHWHFDTIDGLYNNYRGWQVDNVLISATGLVCEDPPSASADLNGDGVVNVFDLLILLAAWGPCDGGSCPADLNADNTVNVFDLLILLAEWGG